MGYRDPEDQKAYHREWRKRNAERMRELWRRANQKKRPRPVTTRPGFFTLARLDSWKLCMHGLYTDSPCRNRPRWRDGNWRVCDAHYSAKCIPIVGEG